MPEPVKLSGMNYKEHVERLTDQRNAEIVAMREQGHTLQEIGDAYDISRERVRQICEGRAALKGAKP